MHSGLSTIALSLYQWSAFPSVFFIFPRPVLTSNVLRHVLLKWTCLANQSPCLHARSVPLIIYCNVHVCDILDFTSWNHTSSFRLCEGTELHWPKCCHHRFPLIVLLLDKHLTWHSLISIISSSWYRLWPFDLYIFIFFYQFVALKSTSDCFVYESMVMHQHVYFNQHWITSVWARMQIALFTSTTEMDSQLPLWDYSLINLKPVRGKGVLSTL